MTGYTPVPAVAAGDWIDEIFINTYWVDNMAAGLPDLFSAVGQLAVGAGVDDMGILNVGADGKVLIANSAQALGVEWGDILLASNRQGGNASDWSVDGTTNYVPTKSKIQVGAGVVAATTNQTTYYVGSITVTFPVAFLNPPIVYVTPTSFSAGTHVFFYTGTITTTSAFIVARVINASSPSTKFNWMAIGEL